MTWFTDSPFERMMTQKPDTGDIGTTRRPSPIPQLVLATLITRGYPLVSGTVSRSCRQRKTHTTN